MAFFARYELKTGTINQVLSMPSFMAKITVLSDGEVLLETESLADTRSEYVKDGVLTPKPQSMIDAQKQS